MKHYISVKITPAVSSLISKSNAKKRPFYAVPNKHNSFTRIPKDDFDEDYTIKLENGESITPTDIDNFIKKLSFRIVDERTLIMDIELINGSNFEESVSIPWPFELNELHSQAHCLRNAHEKIKILLTFLRSAPNNGDQIKIQPKRHSSKNSIIQMLLRNANPLFH